MLAFVGSSDFGPELPATGSDSVELTLAGLVMIGIGVAMARLERRRAPQALHRRNL